MDEELSSIIEVLKKVFQILLKNPEIMTGCDIADSEIKDIEKTQTLSLEVLQHVAGDDFFKTFNEDLDISEEEGNEIDKFLYASARYFLEDLKEEIPYLKE